MVEFSLGNYTLRLFGCALFRFFYRFFSSLILLFSFSYTKFHLFLILNSTAFQLWNLLWEFTFFLKKMKFIKKNTRILLTTVDIYDTI